MSRGTRSRVFLAGSALVGLVVALFALWSGRPGQRQAGQGRPAQELSARAPGARPAPTPPTAPKLLPAARQGGAGETEAVVVQKRSVCRGEDNMVRVSLAGLWQDDPHRRVYLAGHDAVGVELPLRLSRAPDKMPVVIVEGSAGRARVFPLPEVQVRDCEAPYQVNVSRRLLAPTGDRYQFSTDVVTSSKDARSKKFVPVRWHWDFGDGATEMTEYANVTHDYGTRPQGAQYSSFLVRVELAAADGARQVGYTTLELVNWRFAARDRAGAKK